MEDIQSSYEELMSILLLIAGKVACMGPDKVKELEGDMGRVQTRIELLKKVSHFTDHTLLLQGL